MTSTILHKVLLKFLPEPTKRKIVFSTHHLVHKKGAQEVHLYCLRAWLRIMPLRGFGMNRRECRFR